VTFFGGFLGPKLGSPFRLGILYAFSAGLSRAATAGQRTCRGGSCTLPPGAHEGLPYIGGQDARPTIALHPPLRKQVSCPPNSSSFLVIHPVDAFACVVATTLWANLPRITAVVAKKGAALATHEQWKPIAAEGVLGLSATVGTGSVV
jgi:hypothetical protein